MSAAGSTRVALAAGLAAMGTLHFTPSVGRGMRAMIPPELRRAGLPSPADLVRLTGVCELAGAAGLLVRPTRRPAAAALVVFLAAVFPANAHAARHPDRFGVVAVPFWPRLAGQAALGALIAWAGFSRD